MNNTTQASQAIRHDLTQLAEHAHGLLTATADVAGEKVTEARQRLAAALDRGKSACEDAMTEARAEGKVAVQSCQMHPYQTLGLTLGLGAMFGYLFSRRCRCQAA